jgi:ElaB/YqjD/DUF883 family membrane-anchored ribosome-binding protein
MRARAHEKQESEVTAEKLAADLRLVISDAEALLRATVGETAAEGQAKIREGIEAAKLRLGPLAEEAAQHAREADDYVRGHPWQAVGIAVLAGIALGLLIGRK